MIVTLTVKGRMIFKSTESQKETGKAGRNLLYKDAGYGQGISNISVVARVLLS